MRTLAMTGKIDVGYEAHIQPTEPTLTEAK